MNNRTDPILYIVIPCYNEQEVLPITAPMFLQKINDLAAAGKISPESRVLFVNDGSKDSTAAICRERGYHLISLPVNLGLAGAFQTGMKYAYAHGYDYAIQFDADGQHSAAYIDDMVEVAEETGANVVVGSRFADCKKPFSARMAGSALITAMTFVTTRKRIEDPTSGMRLFDSKMIPLFANELDFGPEPDTISLLMRHGYKVEEMQVEMRERTAGESYLNFTKSVSYMLRISLSILIVQWFRRRK